VGQPAEVAVSGNRRKATLYTALNIATGHRCVDGASRWNGETFRAHLRHLRRQWRGWRIVLFLDRGSPHTARDSRNLAAQLGIEVRWLPTACPELNPVEDLWKWLKGKVLNNHQPDDFAETVSTATNAIQNLTKQDTLRLAGLMSGNFWLPT
jgi:transposase